MPVVDNQAKIVPRKNLKMSVRSSKLQMSTGESTSSSDSDSGYAAEILGSVKPRKFVNRYFPQVASVYPQNLWNPFAPNTIPEMVSRRKILSLSRDGLNSDFQEEEDIWFQKEKLFKDHIQEVLNKWRNIDDEIWAKIIVMERNRRVAKAYARAPVLTINGSDDGFDGYRIGLCGFDNPMRDAKTEEIKKLIGHGVKIKMDDGGNILVKRVSKCNVYVKVPSQEHSLSNDAITSGGLLELEKPVKVFDMKKFASNVEKEIMQVYPDRKQLEIQCISALAFVKDSSELLDCSCWVMIINIVALEMLKSKFPPVSKCSRRKTYHHKIFQENPYSIPSNVSESIRTNDTLRDTKPPKLPPRDVDKVPVPMPDYSDWKHDRTTARLPQRSGYKDDPYCCGMKARVPNFVKKYNQHSRMPEQIPPVRKSHSSGYLSLLRQNDSPFDPRRGTNFYTDEEYARMSGKMRAVPSQNQSMFVGEWE